MEVVVGKFNGYDHNQIVFYNQDKVLGYDLEVPDIDFFKKVKTKLMYWDIRFPAAEYHIYVNEVYDFPDFLNLVRSLNDKSLNRYIISFENRFQISKILEDGFIARGHFEAEQAQKQREADDDWE